MNANVVQISKFEPNTPVKVSDAVSTTDAGKLIWVQYFLYGTMRSVNHYSREQLLEKMEEVLDVIGWPDYFRQSAKSDLMPFEIDPKLIDTGGWTGRAGSPLQPITIVPQK